METTIYEGEKIGKLFPEKNNREVVFYIYGAGKIGFYTYLHCMLKGISIEKFIVSQKLEEQTNYLGLPCMCISEFLVENQLQIQKNCILIFLIATSQKYHAEIIDNIQKSIVGDNKIEYRCITEDASELIMQELASDLSWIEKLDDCILKKRVMQHFDLQKVQSMESLYNVFCKNKMWDDYYDIQNKAKEISRYQECEVNIANKVWRIPDIASFLGQVKEILIDEIYHFEPRYKDVYILDFGSNVGTSVRFFRNAYPNAIIEAYEADPKIFEFLKHNIQSIEGDIKTKLFPCAIWDQEEILQFYSEGSDGGRINSEDKENSVSVQAVDARTILRKYERIDFLKIDIEGAETRVIKRIKKELCRVTNIFIEYHSVDGEEQSLWEILFILKEAGFRLKIEGFTLSENPYLKWDVQNGFDTQVNIFGVREEI